MKYGMIHPFYFLCDRKLVANCLYVAKYALLKVT